MDGGAADGQWLLPEQCLSAGPNANTHGIAYALQGLLRIHCILERESHLADLRRTAERMLALYDDKRHLMSEIAENREFMSSQQCLTGYAQLAIVFFRLYGPDGDKRYLDAGLNLLDDVAATLDVTSPDKPHYGGIKGSRSIHARYAPLQYPNWATKFFIDVLLAKRGALTAPSARLPREELTAG